MGSILMIRQNKFNQPNFEEYAVIDSLERRLRKLGFGGDFVFDILAHVRGLKPLERIITYAGDLGTHQYIVEGLGIISQPGSVFFYDTEAGELFLYSIGQSWKKLRIWKSKSYYCLQVME